MKNLILAVMFAASPAAAYQEFDFKTPVVSDILAKTRSLKAASAMPAAATGSPIDKESSNEFSRAPSWFDAAQLKFDALVKSGTGGTAVLRYGWRSQYEMSIFAFPGSSSISFKEYSANPMGRPKRSLDASLDAPAAREAAARLLRAVQAKHPVTGKDKAALDKILAFLDGK